MLDHALVVVLGGSAVLFGGHDAGAAPHQRSGDEWNCAEPPFLLRYSSVLGLLKIYCACGKLCVPPCSYLGQVDGKQDV